MSSEPPRPQPKATLTLFCVIILAVGAQSWSWSVLAGHKREQMRRQHLIEAQRDLEKTDATEGNSSTAREEFNEEERSLLWVARGLDWAPRDPTLFLPKLFRDSPPPPLVELPTEDVDDDRLLNAFSAVESSGASAKSVVQQNIKVIKSTADERTSHSTASHSREPHQEAGVTEQRASSTKTAAQSETTQEEKRPELKQRGSQNMVGASQTLRGEPAQGVDTRQDQEQRRPMIVMGELELQEEGLEEDLKEEVSLDLDWKTRPKRVRKKGGVPLLSIEDPKNALGYFFSRLEQSKSGRKVRVMHYGDSLIAGDYVTSTMRRLLQKRFGYGGLGYVLAGKPSPWYGRTGLKLKSQRWKPDRATRSTSKLSIYGLGGVSFRSKSKRSYLRATVKKQEQLDARVDTLELHYLTQTKGGQVAIKFGPTQQTISTQAERLGVARAVVKAPLGLHKVEIRPVGDGEVRLLGMSLERSGGGVVYDSLGLTGSRAQQQLKWDKEFWVEQAKWRNPDLFVIHYGTNESENKKMSMTRYAEDLSRLIRRLKAVNPKASCLFVSPMDRDYKHAETGRISTRPIIPRIVKTQRETALTEGCAFWSAYDAMGGWGSLKRWYRASPPLAGGDLTHPTRRGANLLGAMFFSAMMEAYAKAGGS